MGIESPLKINMQQLNKSATKEEAQRAVEYLHKHDICAMGGFITANPDDKKEDIATVFKFSKELGCDFLMLQILTPYPKTEMRQMLTEANLVTHPFSYHRYNGFRANVRTRFLSPLKIMCWVSIGNIIWYISEFFKPRNWFNSSKRVLPCVRRQIRVMTWQMVFHFCLGRYGKSSHRF